MFEGEYLKCKRLSGCEYVKGIKEYEGNYLYNKKWRGKGFDENGNVLYELINGTRKVREYEGGDLMFEGEYLNGKRNGKGKEYHHWGTLLYEGEYLNGKRNGKGSEYCYTNGKIMFDAEYLNGEIKRKIKEYDDYLK